MIKYYILKMLIIIKKDAHKHAKNSKNYLYNGEILIKTPSKMSLFPSTLRE